MVIRKFVPWIALLLMLLLGCGKDLSEVLFHPSIDQRFSDSTSGKFAVPTAMTPSSSSSFNFAVFGDIHVNSKNENLLTRFKQDISTNNINFFVGLGDLTEDGTSQEFSSVKSDLDAVGIPYYVTIGNHDLFQAGSNGGWDTWTSTFGAATYGVTIANAVRFLFIDTSSGQVGAQQMNWLRNELSSTSVPFTFVGSHYSIYDGEGPTMWRLESVEERYELMSILNQGGVYAYVGAHTHGFKQNQLGNVLHFVTGSMYHAGLDYGNHGYLLFKYNNGKMTWQQITFPDLP